MNKNQRCENSDQDTGIHWLEGQVVETRGQDNLTGAIKQSAEGTNQGKGGVRKTANESNLLETVSYVVPLEQVCRSDYVQTDEFR